MGAEHVIAIIAALLQVRNQIAINAGRDIEHRQQIADLLGDPIQEARELLQAVVSEVPAMPDAPNTKGGMPSVAVEVAERAG